MPVYEYRCKSCHRSHEIEQGFHDKRPTHCPTCGGELIRVFHPVGLVFKGSGFHRTDYSGAAPPDSGRPDPKATEAKPSSEAKAGATPAQSKKPAADAKSKE